MEGESQRRRRRRREGKGSTGLTLLFPLDSVATYLFWRSAYVSTLYSARNRTLVILDWMKVKIFGR